MEDLVGARVGAASIVAGVLGRVPRRAVAPAALDDAVPSSEAAAGPVRVETGFVCPGVKRRVRQPVEDTAAAAAAAAFLGLGRRRVLRVVHGRCRSLRLDDASDAGPPAGTHAPTCLGRGGRPRRLRRGRVQGRVPRRLLRDAVDVVER